MLSSLTQEKQEIYVRNPYNDKFLFSESTWLRYCSGARRSDDKRFNASQVSNLCHRFTSHRFYHFMGADTGDDSFHRTSNGILCKLWEYYEEDLKNYPG